ncbi:phosphatidate cytidylyltransferase [Sphaerochaeta sp. PS]|uniref:phosphatidate cytidylyltransferase n=1 Tax=Sphaerochaeta sp. PS TaxID=3076336 RepID=UPI0028A4A3A2|nr:phosphatidate cytidylyltransferase [Sphaerochaeta sp. PS]MDT4762871.1 phosphatidate cytidylyltransferase [Sphaerochaeta sp. PS]
MSSLAKRILTTVIAVPALFSIIFFLPHYGYLALALLAMLTASLATMELKALYLKAEGARVNLPSWTVALLPFAQWLEMTFFPNLPLIELTLVVLALVIFSTELSSGPKDEYKKTFSRIGGSALLLIYPGLLITFILRIGSLAHPSAFLLLFFLLVFGNDVFAFLFGMSLGKNNKGIIKVSPNKSIAGFVGGTLSTVILSFLFCYFVPGVKEDVGIFQAILLGLFTSISANIGDLIESAFKRAANVKDSGNLIPGRGGLLDSIDSLLASAPVYWLLLILF